MSHRRDPGQSSAGVQHEGGCCCPVLRLLESHGEGVAAGGGGGRGHHHEGSPVRYGHTVQGTEETSEIQYYGFLVYRQYLIYVSTKRMSPLQLPNYQNDLLSTY